MLRLPYKWAPSAALCFLLCVVVEGKGKEGSATDGGRGDAVEVETFDWTRGKELLKTTAFVMDQEPKEPHDRRLEAAKAPASRAKGKKASSQAAGRRKESKATDGGPTEGAVEVGTFDWTGAKKEQVLKTTAYVVDRDPEEEAEEPRGRRLGDLEGAERRTSEVPRGTGSLLDALWDRPKWRDARFKLHASPGEHPCFAGFKSMLRDTDRCKGFVRQYPPVGGKVAYTNTGVGGRRPFTLRAVIADHINVWLEQGTTETHADVSIKAAKIYANELDIPELRPAAGSKSWMEHECKVMGSMPFMYTCSDRINILVQECRISNAWVMQSDYLRNFPEPANNKSGPNHDIIFYMCKEIIDSNGNPYAAANTFAHELAHVIQGGFGYSFNAMTEGGATWLEGALLGLPPRPMVYAWGFRDWNRINAAHLYANTKELNSRKFYQIHAMLLTYLSQDTLLGDAATSALQNYQTFENTHVPWGRMAYDYFLSHLGSGRPADFSTVKMDVKDTQNAFANALLDFRVALASQCITDASRRPTESRYLMPERLRDQPFWDCSSYPTYWSASASAVTNASADISYGGAAVFRLAAPRGATVSVAADADPQVRTKVLAAGTGPGGVAAEVRELERGESVTFPGGARELFVVQVNVDPVGESISPQLWKRSSYKCAGLCSGRAWTIAKGGGRRYPDDSLSSLRSPAVQLPSTAASLSFAAMWDMEGLTTDGGSLMPGCVAKGYDGVQVRIHVLEGSGASPSSGKDGSNVAVLLPEGGYGKSANNATGIHVFAKTGLVPKATASCGDFEGWSGRSAGAGGALAFARQNFSLAPYAGKRVKLEFLFASDSSVGGEGFWVDNIEIKAGSEVVFSDNADGAARMAEYTFSVAPAAGSLGPVDGVPVVADLPKGLRPDRGLQKASETRKAPWSAVWQSPPRWVGLKTSHGTYVVAEPSGTVMADRNELRSWEQFQLIHNDCGTISFKSHHGKYLTASAGGSLSANGQDLTRMAKFRLVNNVCGTISLRTSYNKYVTAQESGELSARSEAVDRPEKFRFVYLPSERLDEVSQRRSHLGWSYSAGVRKTETALLHPWQEACVRHEAPFKGRLQHATLFLLVDKMGVGSVTLTARAASSPYTKLGDGPVVSPSPGVADAGIHRFDMRGAPLLREGEAFLLCAGVGSVKPLPADDPLREPFFHLPLTNVSTAASADQPGATFLLVTQDHGAMRSGDTSELDPWKGHTFTLRADFLEEAGAAAPSSSRSRGFLAGGEPQSTFYP